MSTQNTEFQDQLVRGLAHKMNNILSLFHGYLALVMEDEELSPEAMDGLSRIKEGAHAASDLIDRTKALARPSSLIWRELKMPDFFYSIETTLKAHLERGITMELFCEPDVPPLWADAVRVRTVLNEVMKNAIEASPDGGVIRVRIAPDSVGKPNAARGTSIRWVAIRVINTGAKIPKEIVDRIFDPFFSTHAPRGAAGLGLTVAKNLMHQLGGIIHCKSEVGRTELKLRFPSRTA